MKLSKKEIDKAIKDSIQMDAKKGQFKSRGNIFYKKMGEYFIRIMIRSSGLKQEYIKVRGDIKPYVVDDIFWEVFHMPDNSREPMGLRANGAFAVEPLNVFEEFVEYREAEKIGTISRELFSKCYERVMYAVKSFGNLNDFLLFAETEGVNQLFDYDLVNMLFLIDGKRYQEAEEIAKEQISNKNYGRFKNEGKFIYERIVDYCDCGL